MVDSQLQLISSLISAHDPGQLVDLAPGSHTVWRVIRTNSLRLLRGRVGEGGIEYRGWIRGGGAFRAPEPESCSVPDGPWDIETRMQGLDRTDVFHSRDRGCSHKASQYAKRGGIQGPRGVTKRLNSEYFYSYCNLR